MPPMAHDDCYNLVPPVGENLAMNMPQFDIAAWSVKKWYDEVNDCASLPGCTSSTGGAVGHFTALVWKGVKEIGCGTAVSGRNNYYVCRYYSGDTKGPDTANFGRSDNYVANVMDLCKTEEQCRSELS